MPRESMMSRGAQSQASRAIPTIPVKPAVSILVPSYNHAPYVGEAVASVLAQTLDAWEMLVLDDCSRDATLEAARTAAAGDPRVRIERNTENLGTYRTLARALSQTTAAWVAVLNSDDRWHPAKLERQLETLRPGDRLAYTLGRTIDAQGAAAASDVHGDWPREPSQDVLPRLLEENRILASSVVFARDAVRFEPECRTSGDWVALLEAAAPGPVRCVPEPLCEWRLHGANSYTQSPAQMAEEIRVREAILASRDAWRVPGRSERGVRHGLARCALHLAAAHVFFGDHAAAVEAASLAARIEPTRATLRRLAVCLLPAEAARRSLWGSPEAAPNPPSPALELRAVDRPQ